MSMRPNMWQQQANNHIKIIKEEHAKELEKLESELSRLREERKELVEALREAKICIKQNTPNSWITPDWMNLMKRIESLLSKFEATEPKQ